MAKKNNDCEIKNRNRNIKKIIGYGVSGVLVVILCLVIIAFVVVFVQIGQGKTPSLLGYRFYYVLTDSMTPAIKPGDVILSKSFDESKAEELKIGDIVTYTATTGVMANKQVTHRIVKEVYFDEALNSYAVWTKGDKQGAKVDDPVKISSINAVMVKKSAFLSWLYGVMNGGSALALIIAIPLALMLICLVIKLIITLKTPSTEAEKEKNDRIDELKKQAIGEYLSQNKDNKKV